MKTSIAAFSILFLSISGCAAELTPKAESEARDASSLPFDYEDEAKADSARSPIDGGELTFGAQIEGTMTSRRGWIGYEIQLSAGPVDLDVTGLDSRGQQLDTLLYVFGPKSARGRYPQSVLAFNDDMEPGVNFGSHILLDVPTDGTYRVVVSTFDNYVTYPANVSRGTYTLTAKCPREGASCAPGGDAPARWLSIAPVQCNGNPWSTTEDTSGRFGEGFGDLGQVLTFFSSQGIEITELGSLKPAVTRYICRACVCPRGDLLVVKASGASAERLEREFGFAPFTLSAFATGPRQCGSNPWEADRSEDGEVSQVIAWAEGFGASLSDVGFVYRTTPMAVCLACSCPRGDTLVVTTGVEETRALLTERGLSSWPTAE